MTMYVFCCQATAAEDNMILIWYWQGANNKEDIARKDAFKVFDIITEVESS